MIDPSIPLGVRPAQFNLGDMLGAMQGMQQMRAQGQQQRLGALRLQAAEDEQAGDAAVRAVLQQHVGPDGRPDYNAAATKLESGGFGIEAQKLRKFQLEQQKATEDAAKAALETEGKRYEIVGQRGGLAYNALAAALDDPAKYAKARADAIKLVPSAEEYLPTQHDKTKIQAAMKWWEATKPAIEARAATIADIHANGFTQKTDQEALDFWGKNLARYLPTTSNQEEWSKALAMVPEPQRARLVAQYGDTYSPEAAKQAAVISMTPEKRAELAGQDASRALTAAGQRETARHNRVGEANEAHRLANEENSVPALTPDALDAVAHQFAMTGQLPPMGMGSKAGKVRTQIINRAAELYKDLDIPSQQAAFKANRDSLGKLQGQRDAVHSFEQTAKKNIDVFLETAGKVVDTGSPMMNTLARQASGKMLGSTDQAKYDAARAVVLPEIAKIINNPNLTGVLSDSARDEIAEFNPQNATLAQTVSVMRLLQRDMDNRMTSIDDEIAAVKGRIARAPSAKPAESSPSSTVKMQAPDGSTQDVPAALVDHYKQLGAKVIR